MIPLGVADCLLTTRSCSTDTWTVVSSFPSSVAGDWIVTRRFPSFDVSDTSLTLQLERLASLLLIWAVLSFSELIFRSRESTSDLCHSQVLSSFFCTSK